jgi:AraC-like DNA-binding protein
MIAMRLLNTEDDLQTVKRALMNSLQRSGTVQTPYNHIHAGEMIIFERGDVCVEFGLNGGLFVRPVNGDGGAYIGAGFGGNKHWQMARENGGYVLYHVTYAHCPASAPMRQIWRVEERGFPGRKSLWRCVPSGRDVTPLLPGMFSNLEAKIIYLTFMEWRVYSGLHLVKSLQRHAAERAEVHVVRVDSLAPISQFRLPNDKPKHAIFHEKMPLAREWHSHDHGFAARSEFCMILHRRFPFWFLSVRISSRVELLMTATSMCGRSIQQAPALAYRSPIWFTWSDVSSLEYQIADRLKVNRGWGFEKAGLLAFFLTSRISPNMEPPAELERGSDKVDYGTASPRKEDSPQTASATRRRQTSDRRRTWLCAALTVDRLTHHVHILELNGESYRLKHSKARRRRDPRPADEAADPETGEITSDSWKPHSPRLRNPDHLRRGGCGASSSTPTKQTGLVLLRPAGRFLLRRWQFSENRLNRYAHVRVYPHQHFNFGITASCLPPCTAQCQFRFTAASQRSLVRFPFLDHTSEVAFAVGFADQSHFTRRFRQMVDVSPGRFRKL